jgi:hypothetical protein
LPRFSFWQATKALVLLVVVVVVTKIIEGGGSKEGVVES